MKFHSLIKQAFWLVQVSDLPCFCSWGPLEGDTLPFDDACLSKEPGKRK